MSERGRRNLVLARAGDRSLHRAWLDGAPARSWDLQISFYGTDPATAADGDFAVVVDRGTKWDSICRYLDANPSVLERYDYICMPDDDLRFDPGALDRLFDIAAGHQLMIAQPALNWDSYFSYPITLKSSLFKLRFSNFVECMAPCISTDYLRQILPILRGAFSGWGIDLVWALLMPEPRYRSAIVDAAGMTHTRPLFTGSIYRSLAGSGLKAPDELKATLARYVNPPDRMVVYGGILRGGARVGEMQARLLNGLQLLANAHRAMNSRPAVLRSAAGMAVRLLAVYEPAQLVPRDPLPA